MSGTAPAASATERDQLAEVTDVFNRVCDEITARCGAPFLRTKDFVTRHDESFITAGWFIDGANHGFKIKRDRDVWEILTWAHVGDFASAKVWLRSTSLIESTLRSVLPPGLAPAAAPVELPHSDAHLIAEAARHGRDYTLRQVISLVEEQRDSGVLDLEQLLADLRKLQEGSRG